MASPTLAIVSRRFGLALVLGLAPAAAGCGQRPSLELEPVEGRVWLGGQLLKSGSVSLYPLDPALEVQQLPMGSIEADGSYRVYYARRPGCPLGSFRVVVFANEAAARGQSAHAGLPRSIIAACYNAPATTPLRLDVVRSAEASHYDLRLDP